LPRRFRALDSVCAHQPLDPATADQLTGHVVDVVARQGLPDREEPGQRQRGVVGHG